MNVDILPQEISEASKMGRGYPIAWYRVRDSEEEMYSTAQDWILQYVHSEKIL